MASPDIPAEMNERVERGIAFLDENHPGWRSQVVPDDLDMGDCTACIFGQLYGDYDEGLKLLPENAWDAPPWEAPTWYGFEISPLEEDTYDLLTAAWRERLGA